VGTIHLIYGSGSISILTIIAYERWRAICYNDPLNRRRVLTYVIVHYALAALIILLPAFDSRIDGDLVLDPVGISCIPALRSSVQVAIGAPLCLIIPFGLMFVMYYRMYRTIHHTTMETLANCGVDGKSRLRIIKKDQKIGHFMFLCSLSFALTWSMFIVTFLCAIADYPVGPLWDGISLVVAALGLSCQPILYGLFTLDLGDCCIRLRRFGWRNKNLASIAPVPPTTSVIMSRRPANNNTGDGRGSLLGAPTSDGGTRRDQQRAVTFADKAATTPANATHHGWGVPSQRLSRMSVVSQSSAGAMFAPQWSVAIRPPLNLTITGTGTAGGNSSPGNGNSPAQPASPVSAGPRRFSHSINAHGLLTTTDAKRLDAPDGVLVSPTVSPLPPAITSRSGISPHGHKNGTSATWSNTIPPLSINSHHNNNNNNNGGQSPHYHHPHNGNTTPTSSLRSPRTPGSGGGASLTVLPMTRLPTGNGISGTMSVIAKGSSAATSNNNNITIGNMITSAPMPRRSSPSLISLNLAGHTISEEASHRRSSAACSTADITIPHQRSPIVLRQISSSGIAPATLSIATSVSGSSGITTITPTTTMTTPSNNANTTTTSTTPSSTTISLVTAPTTGSSIPVAQASPTSLLRMESASRLHALNLSLPYSRTFSDPMIGPTGGTLPPPTSYAINSNTTTSVATTTSSVGGSLILLSPRTSASHTNTGSSLLISPHSHHHTILSPTNASSSSTHHSIINSTSSSNHSNHVSPVAGHHHIQLSPLPPPRQSETGSILKLHR
jgi:hypothetical protein